MKPRTTSRIAWSVGLFTIVLMVGALVVMLVDRHAVLPAGATRWRSSDVLLELSVVGVPTVVGILLASRRPENSIGWLLLVQALALGLGLFGEVYGVHALVADRGSLPAGRAIAWFSNWVYSIDFGVLAFLLLLFPTGHVPSRRWRPVAWFTAGASALLTGAFLVIATRVWSDPFGQPTNSQPVLVSVTIVAAVGACVAAAVVRFRGSVGEERLQLKWFATAAVVVLVVVAVPSSSQSVVGTIAISLALLFLFASIGIAILKYRLYEIDVVISKAVVYGSLAVFITFVYVGLVVGVGSLVGNRQSPLLSALAAALVAVAFQPVRQRAGRLANRVVYGKRATPYEVLSDFAGRIAGTYSSEDVLPQMARIVAAGTGAERAVVWLRVGDELRPEASSDGVPDAPVIPIEGGTSPSPPGETGVPVTHDGELLGTISIRMPRGETLTPSGERLVSDVASQAGLVLRNVRLIEELRASRQRIVAAQDAAARRLERNIHDGAQQQLVALAVKVRLARSFSTRDPQKVDALLEQTEHELTQAMDDLRDLARGIYPPLLADRGLVTALQAQARRSAVPVTVETDGISRYPQDTEAAVYFCTLEALQNVAKYANASNAIVALAELGDSLTFTVRDDGVGFDPAAKGYGTGMQGMSDRLAALGGQLRVTSAPGDGTLIEGSVPIDRLAPSTSP